MMAASLAPPHPMPTSGPLAATLVEDERQWLALEREWNPLVSLSASNNPFLTWEWLHAWWTHLRGHGHLHVVAVRDAGALIAAAPLIQFGDRLRLLSRLAWLGTGDAGSDYLDVIARAGRERDGLDAMAPLLARGAVRLHLDHLPPRSLAARLPRHFEDAGWTADLRTQEYCPVISLLGHSWDSYLATRGSSHRANVRRRLRALERAFAMTFEPVRSLEQCRTALADLMRFHERRWHGRGGSTAFFTPELRAFHDDVARRMLMRGWLRLYTLRLDGATAAVMYGFAYNRRFYFYQHGFDESLGHYGVGLVLMALTIRAALSEGAAEFDMLYGREPYKRLWTTSQRALQQLDLFPPSFSGRLQRRAVDTRRALGTVARRFGLRRHADAA